MRIENPSLIYFIIVFFKISSHIVFSFQSLSNPMEKAFLHQLYWHNPKLFGSACLFWFGNRKDDLFFRWIIPPINAKSK